MKIHVPEPSIVAGIDGCPAGWVAATWDLATDTYDVTVHATFADLRAALPAMACYAIDIPIGLADVHPRAADRAVRRFLGPRRSSVFPAPIRSVVACDSYESACQVSFEQTGKRISRQTYWIIPKIREVDAALQTDLALRDRVVEVHPEVSFALCNAGEPLSHPKRTASGRRERLALLSAAALAAYDQAMRTYPRAAVRSDDIIDALVAAWTAHRVRMGTAERFPADQESRDVTGLEMSIKA